MRPNHGVPTFKPAAPVQKANAANGFTITAPPSRITAHVIATDEEQIIAQEALTILRS